MVDLTNLLKRTICSIKNCGITDKIVKGLCRNHYRSLRKYGDPLYSKKKKPTRKLLRNQLIILLGSCCEDCSFWDRRALQIGHRNGKGNIDRKRFSGDYEFYQYYIEHQEEAKMILKLLCANCNWIQKYNTKEWANKYTIIKAGRIHA